MGGVWESLALPEPSPCQHFPAGKGEGESPSAYCKSKCEQLVCSLEVKH